MSPKLYLYVANLLHGSVHLTEEALEFDHIGELRVDVFVIEVILLDELFDDVFVPKNGKLLLQRRLLLLGYVELDDRSVNVLHDLVLIERECDVNAGAVYELVQRLLIQSHYEVLEKNLVLVRCLSLAVPVPIRLDIK